MRLVEEIRLAKATVDALTLLLICSTAAMASDRAHNQLVYFDVPRHRADVSLTLFVEQANLTLIIPYEVARKITTNRVQGTHTVAEAIEILLAGTDLMPVFSDQGLLTNITDRRSVTEEDRMIAKEKGLLAGLIAVFVGAGAAAQEESSAYLEEIVVTAQKRAQNLQDVPAAVTNVGGEFLADAGISDIAGLQHVVPNLSLGDTFSFANLFSRGLGLNTSFGNVDPSVALYSDGAVIAQAGAQLFSFFDLERVEVLRGPQGTLYGRNSTGGLINLITKKPTEEFTGNLDVKVGNYGSLEFEGAVGGALIDGKLSGRIAAFSQTRDGFGTNVVTANDVDDRNRQGVRAQLLWAASDATDVSFIAEYGRQNDASGGFSFQEVTFPDPLNDNNPNNDNFGAPGLGGFANSGEARDQASDVDPSNDRRTFSLTNIIEWQVNDNFSIKNTINYRDFKSILIQDLDLSAVINSSIEYFLFETEQITEELQFVYNTENFNFIGGIYYFDEEVDNILGFGITGSGANEGDPSLPGGGRRVFITGTGTTESLAAFWNITYDFSDAFSIRVGGRYTEDERAIFDNNLFITVGPPGGRFQITPPGFEGEATFTDYTGEFGIDYRPSDDLLLYYTYSEGFKAGTQQISPPSVPSGFVNPEKIANHEIGVKATFNEGRVIANIAAFSYGLENLQLDRTIPGGPAGFTSEFVNATTLDGEGVEVELLLRPSSAFTLNGSVAYLNTELGNFLTIDPLTLMDVNIGGNSGRQSPELTFALNADYEIALSNGAAVTLTGAVSYKDDQFFSEFNTERLFQDSYTLVDARIAYLLPESDIEIALWGKNLSDEDIAGGAFAISTGRSIGTTFLPPRTYGISFGTRF